MSSVALMESPRAVDVLERASVATQPTSVEILSGQRDTQWEASVAAHPDATLFHTLAWRDSVEGAFGHEAVYLTAVREGLVVGLLPMFLVSSRFTGRMLVSVPYAVGGGIVADGAEVVDALFTEARRIAGDRRCPSIDLRSEKAVIPGIPVLDRYAGFERELPDGPGDVLGWLPRKARAAARNARNKYRLTVTFGDEQLRDVWRLYSISMRRLGSLAYPFAFFERLIVGTPGGHWVSIVRWNGEPVAGLVTFLFKDRVMPYFIGTTDDAKRCSAANFIYLTAIERGVECGYRVFDFGRSRRDNKGSYDFKRFNGFEPRPLGYQYYTAPGHAAPNLSPGDAKFRVARKVWTRLPLGMTQVLGARLARHIPG